MAIMCEVLHPFKVRPIIAKLFRGKDPVGGSRRAPMRRIKFYGPLFTVAWKALWD